MLGRTRCDHGAATGTGTAGRARRTAAADGLGATAGIFLCAAAYGRAAATGLSPCAAATTVTAGRLPAAAAATTGLPLRSAATGPNTGRHAGHRGGLPDAEAGGGGTATARLSAVVLAATRRSVLAALRRKRLRESASASWQPFQPLTQNAPAASAEPTQGICTTTLGPVYASQARARVFRDAVGM
jgi:hypothetical protein